MVQMKILIMAILCVSLAQAQTRQNNVLNIKKVSADTAAIRRAYVGGTLGTLSQADSELTVLHGAHVNGGAKVDGTVTVSGAVVRGSSPAPYLVTTNSAKNTNFTTAAQAGDTCAIGDSITTSKKPIWWINDSTGTQLLGVDSLGNLVSGRVVSRGTTDAIDFTRSGTGVTILLDGYGGSNSIVGRGVGGTVSSPSVTPSATGLMAIKGGGYDGSALTGTRGQVTVNSSANWSATSTPTLISFQTTKQGTTTLTEKMRVNDSGYVEMGSPFLKINGVVLEGFGVAALVDTIDRSGQTASIGTTNFNNSSTAGHYRIGWYISCTSANGTASVTANLAWNDGSSKTKNGASVSMSSTSNSDQGCLFVRNASGSITWGATVSGTIGTAVFLVAFSCERLD